MKLTETTILLLKNFARFNPHIVIEEGNIIRTCSDKKTVLVRAVVDDEFEHELVLGDITEFLKVYDLFDEPELTIDGDVILLTDVSGASQEYYMSDKEELIFELRDVKKPLGEVNIELPYALLDRALKAAAVNGVEDIAVVAENGQVFLKALDKENPKKIFSVLLSSEDMGEFTAYFKHTKKGVKLDLLPLDYNLNINTECGCARFISESDGLELIYTIALQRDSKF